METQQIQLQKVEIGSIFVNTWGYDQTNQDFYIVISKTEKSIKIKQLKTKITETGFMSGIIEPLKEFKEDSEVLTKRLKYDNEGEAYINMEFGWCDLWDNKPKSCSWYA